MKTLKIKKRENTILTAEDGADASDHPSAVLNIIYDDSSARGIYLIVSQAFKLSEWLDDWAVENNK